MKKIIILLFLTFSLLTKAQTHVPVSKSIVGIWKQTGAALENGKLVEQLTPFYKVINADGTYYTFEASPYETTIWQYGSYTIKSDNLLVEHIINHGMDSNLNGKDSSIKYKLTDENTMLMAWSTDNEHWISEKWTRLPLAW